MSARRATVVVAVVLLVSAFLSACGASSTNSPPSAEPQSVSHNAADLMFALDMIPHHQQAVVLAAMVPARTANADLRMMATHIGSDQQAELRTLDGLLAQWGESGASGGMAGHDHMTMAGMVDQATMDRLGTLNGSAFDTLWVTSMIGHHRGAIAMANDEIANGQSADAKQVARVIVTAQEREIAMLTHLISASQ